MDEQLIKFIELCLADGVITDKEREVIFRKAKKLGVDEDECEIILEGMSQQVKIQPIANITPLAVEKENRKKNNNIIKKYTKIPPAKLDKEGVIKLVNLVKSVEINKRNEEINKQKYFITAKEKEFKSLLDDVEKNFLEFFKTLDKSDKFELFGLGKLDEIIESEQINNFKESYGTIKWGRNASKLKPELPHPISVIYNYQILGDSNYLEGYYRQDGYIQNDFLGKQEFIYNKSKPRKSILKSKTKPLSLIIFSKSKHEKNVIVVYKTFHVLINLKYNVELKKIKYILPYKSYLFTKIEENSDFEILAYNIYHTYITVEHDISDLKPQFLPAGLDAGWIHNHWL